MNSLVGQLLIASPQLADPNFARAVILMIQHGAPGAFGVVLNQPSDTLLRDLWMRIQEQEIESDQFVAFGGPVDGPLLVLHTNKDYADEKVTQDIFVASSVENVGSVINEGRTPFRVFSGYSGWGPGQLESELEVGGWLQIPATSELVFDDELSEMWQAAIHDSGQQFLRDTLGIRQFPSDSSHN